MMTEDTELIESYKNGDELSFKLILDKYTPAIFNFVARMAGRENADDITQDVFIKVWKNLKNFNETKASFKTWLFTIAKNTTVDFLRKKKSIRFSDFKNSDDTESTFEENIPDTEILPDELLQKMSDVETLNKTLEQIPERYRAVLTLHYQEDMTFEEIGTVLETSINTVKSQHRRALLLLRKLLEKENKFL